MQSGLGAGAEHRNARDLLSALAQPLVWGPWGSIFEVCSAIAGALIVYASFDRGNPLRAAGITRLAYFAFGICVFFFLFGDLPAFCKCHITRSGGIPEWLFPGKAFWTVVVMCSWPIASVALLSGRCALLAARMLTAVIMIIQLLYWVPRAARAELSFPRRLVLHHTFEMLATGIEAR
ncbi:MAG TPA: hypothetical protein VN735_12500 [Steroidobacteraceae bacterium]|nr:hypothetical protein [Steroidobacteraceae bacterium]